MTCKQAFAQFFRRILKMAGWKQIFVQPIDAVSVDELDDLGDIQWRGSRAYKYIQWITAAPIVAGAVCMYSSTGDSGGTSTRQAVIQSNGGYVAAGITMVAMVQNDYAWIQIKGHTVVSFDTSGNTNNDALTTRDATTGELQSVDALDEAICATQGLSGSDVIFCDFPF